MKTEDDVVKAGKPSFLRRTKPTPATPSTASDVTELPQVDTTTSKYTRRGGNRFKTRKPEPFRKTDGKTESEKQVTIETARRPSSSGAGARSERPRNFARRRLGGANGTTSSVSSTQSPNVVTRRPFRVASRRRANATSSTANYPTNPTENYPANPTANYPTILPTNPTAAGLSSASPATISEETTTVFIDESLQDVDDTAVETYEDPAFQESKTTNRTRTTVRRPLLLKGLEDDHPDQNPSATNEDERKRHSKKFSASIKRNQLEEVIKKAKSKEESSREIDGTTEGLSRTTVDDYSAETALAIATHQLLSAPLPSHDLDHDERPKPTTFKYTGFTDKYTEAPRDELSSTPIYKTSTNRQFNTFASLNNPRTSSTFTAPKSSTYKSIEPSTHSAFPDPATYPSPFIAKVSRPAGFAPPEIITLSQGPSTLSSYSSSTTNPRFSSTFPVPQSLPTSSRYLPNQKLIPVPVEDYSFAPGGYSDVREPAYFTREYLLESPVTKTYDDEYQYLSPVTTPQTTTRKTPKKTVQKKISTTLRPTIPAYVSPVTSSPRRVPSRKPFEKVPFEKVAKPTKTYYKPVSEYDYYDDGDEKVAEKYGEGTKVVLHDKGIIECLDMGNFPHPTSCKKFISCARIENGSILGWEYICPKGLSFDPVGGLCNWSAGLGCDEKYV